jgi:chondroitin 4-sulfotransferase 11
MTVIGSDFIFIHVPKCAGKSISRRLGGVTQGVPGHAPLSYFSEAERQGKFTFGFVRNPWDRMVSAYVFITTKRPRPADDIKHRAVAIEVGFKRWLMETELYFGQEIQSKTTDLPPFQRRSQMYWLDGCDFIGRTEAIDADFKTIESKIARSKSLLYRLRYSGQIERRNSTRRSSYADYYDRESQEFVADYAAHEIALFNYKFETE